jgi:hypothetical protein
MDTLRSLVERMAPNLQAAFLGHPTSPAAQTVGAVTADLVLDNVPSPEVGQLSPTGFNVALVIVICRRIDANEVPVIFSGTVLGSFDGTTITVDSASAIAKTSTAASTIAAAFSDGGSGQLEVRMTGVAARTYSHQAFVFMPAAH